MFLIFIRRFEPFNIFHTKDIDYNSRLTAHECETAINNVLRYKDYKLSLLNECLTIHNTFCKHCFFQSNNAI